MYNALIANPMVANVSSFGQPIAYKRSMDSRNALAQMYQQPPRGNALAAAAQEPTYGADDAAMAQSMANTDWLRYANDGAIRNKPISPKLAEALSFLGELGVEMEVFSGGQDAKGHGDRRTGSTRHDHGNAADVFFYKDGRKLDWSNPEDRPIFEEIVRRAKMRGVTGIGAGEGYMRPGSMHIGFGSEAVWGAGGSGDAAADWLRRAYYG